ncbi:MAG: muconolactone Delta-isomerase [Acetobacteraceae bacterium]
MQNLEEFLVNIQFVGVDRIPADAVEDLRRRERARARELADQGHLLRMWRTPGRRANWGLWAAENATQLHAILESLPYWPYMEIAVHPLARHVVDPVYGSDPRPGPED